MAMVGAAGSPRRSRSVLRIGALLCVLAACSDPLGPAQDDLAEAMARWDRAGFEDYVFEFQRLCFCGGDTIRRLRIEVRSGSVAGAIYVDTGEPVGGDAPIETPTIEDLFEEIQDAIDREAHEVEASYHADLGYPTAVSIDYIENTVDEEMAFHVFVFVLAPSGHSLQSDPRSPRR